MARIVRLYASRRLCLLYVSLSIIRLDCHRFSQRGRWNQAKKPLPDRSRPQRHSASLRYSTTSSCFSLKTRLQSIHICADCLRELYRSFDYPQQVSISSWAPAADRPVEAENLLGRHGYTGYSPADLHLFDRATLLRSHAEYIVDLRPAPSYLDTIPHSRTRATR